MDVVKTSIVSLNGSVHIDSTWGKGTRLEIKVPLTLAILPTLMVEVGEQTFALPLGCVNEIFHLDLKKANMVDGQLTIIVREKPSRSSICTTGWSGASTRSHGRIRVMWSSCRLARSRSVLSWIT